MDQRTKEAIRYLGFGRHAVDDQTMSLIFRSFQELEDIVNARFIYRIFELNFKDDDFLEIGTLKVKSRHLRKNLEGCEKAVLFGATLGTGVDLLMKKRSLTDMAGVVVLQACAAAMLEEFCDQVCQELSCRMKKEDQYLRPRFSPGYGDFSMEHQGEILRMLEAPKQIGLTMTDSSMLVPTKSVTAVIGIGKEERTDRKEGCQICNKKDCLYKRSK